MIYKFDVNSFDLNGKTTLYDDNNNVVMWGQYDFAYKGRIVLHDSNDIDLAYIQFNILSESKYIGLYDMNNNLLNYINIDNKNVMLDDNWNINVDSIMCGSDIIAKFTNSSIETNNDLLKCIFCLYVLNNK